MLLLRTTGRMGLDPSEGDRASSALVTGVPCLLIAGLGTGFRAMGERICPLAGKVFTGDDLVGEDLLGDGDGACLTGDGDMGPGVSIDFGVRV